MCLVRYLWYTLKLHTVLLLVKTFFPLLVGLLSTSLPFLSLPSYCSGSCPQVSHLHHCLLIGRALVHKSPIFIFAFLLVGLMSSSLPFDHPCNFIGRALVLKSPMFILAFILVRLLSSSLLCSSLPSYWSGFCPQVSHFQPCLLIGGALLLKCPMLSILFSH